MEATDFANGLAAVMIEGKWGYIDKTGTLVIPCRYDWAGPFTDSLAPVESEEMVGYIDRRGEITLPYQFRDGRNFSDGLAPVTLDGCKWGYIDTSGKMVIQPRFKRAFPFSSGRALVYTNKRIEYKPTISDLPALMKSARSLKCQSDLNNARHICEKILEIGPDTTSGASAKILLETGLPFRDVKHESQHAYKGGLIMSTNHQYTDALKYYEKALQAEPECFVYMGGLAYVYTELKQFEKAEALMKRALELNPKYARGYYRLSLVESGRGNKARAVEYLKKARELDPGDTWF